MENRISGSDGGVLTAERLPGDANTRFESSFVQSDANGGITPRAKSAAGERNTSGNQKPATPEVEVRLSVSILRGRRGQRPSQPDIEGQVGGNPPVILNVRSEQFPASTCGGAKEGLVMDSTQRLAEKKVCCAVASKGRAERDEEAILKGIGLNIHLHGANRTAKADVVLAANHIERIGYIENVGPALERGESSVTQSPVATHQGRGQTATHAVACRLRKSRDS